MKLFKETTVAVDATTNLDQLLDRVEKGETVVIIRNGVRVARLTSYIDRDKVRKTIEELKKFSKGRHLPPGETIKDLINEGRRF